MSWAAESCARCEGVTGGAGFIGANLAKRLLECGYDVVVLDDLSTGNLRNLAELDVEFVEGFILDNSALAKAVDGADSVVHLAAVPSAPRSIKDPMRSHEVNLALGTNSTLLDLIALMEEVLGHSRDW